MPRKQHALVVLSACLLLLVVSARVRAQQPANDLSLSTPVEPGAKATDLDLIRMVLPDVVEDDHGNTIAHKTTDLRNLFDDKDEPGSYEGDIKLESFIKRPLRAGAHRDWCYLFTLSSTGADNLFTWGDAHVVALFRLEPQPRLLDAAEVQDDRFVDLSSVIAIGPHKEALIIANSHSNSSEGYLQLTVISAEQDRLRLVYDQAQIVRANACGYNFDMTPDLTPIKQGRGTHYPLRLRVKLELMADDPSCEHRRRTRAVTRYYQAPLVWQPKQRQYVVRGHGMDWIDRFEKAYINQP